MNGMSAVEVSAVEVRAVEVSAVEVSTEELEEVTESMRNGLKRRADWPHSEFEVTDETNPWQTKTHLIVSNDIKAISAKMVTTYGYHRD